MSVSVRSGRTETHLRKIRADESGAFELTFSELRIDRLSGDLDVSAVGTDGSEASFSLRRLHGGDTADR